MARPAGLTLIAPKPVTVAVLLPESAIVEALALASCAPKSSGTTESTIAGRPSPYNYRQVPPTT